MKLLQLLHREINDSMAELDEISPSYEKKMSTEKDISKGYVCNEIDMVLSRSVDFKKLHG